MGRGFPVKPRVLSVSHDDVVLSTRNQVLVQAGYHVTTTTELEQAVACLTEQPFDVVVLGDSIQANLRHQLAGKVKATRPSTAVLMLYLPGEAPPPKGHVDAMVGSLDGPEALLAAIQGLLPERRRASSSR
jgi:DNA-binding NtrC family response regulator